MEQEQQWPLIIKSGYNGEGKRVQFYFNYSDDTEEAVYVGKSGINLLTKEQMEHREKITINGWNFAVIEEE